MITQFIDSNTITVIDGFHGENISRKYITYKFDFRDGQLNGGRIIDRSGEWTPVRSKAAWNAALKAVTLGR